MSSGKLLRLILTVEGVEIPIIAAVVNFGVNKPATARVMIVPIPEVRKLKPRSMVHVFYLDSRDMQYKVLFVGEFISLSFVKTAVGRAAELTCVDMTSYWDAARLYYFDELSFDTSGKIVDVFAGAKRGPSDVLFGPAAALGHLLKQKCRSYPGMKGALSRIIRVIEAIGGYNEPGARTRGISDFFTIAQLRCRLYEQIGASEKDDTTDRLLDSEEFYRYLRSIAGRGGNLTSLRQALMGLLHVFRYQYVSNPCPRYVVGSVQGRKHVSKPAPDEVVSQVSSLLKSLPKKTSTVFYVITRVPSCEHPDLTNAQKALLAEAEKNVAAYNNAVREYQKEVKWFVQTALRPGRDVPPKIKPLLDAVYRALDAVVKDYSKFMSLYSTARVWYGPSAPYERLLTTLFMPNIFYAPPPRCNVIFPEHSKSLTWVRNYLSEPTRLLVTVPTDFLNVFDGTSILWSKQYYFAPNILDIHGKKLSKEAYKAKMVVLPHEIHTGPVPSIESFSDIREYDPVLQWSGGSIARRIDRDQKRAMEQTRGLRDPLSYIEHMTNWMFVTQRYGQRTISIPLTFSPELVAGLPALLVNHKMYDDASTTHLLGVPVDVTHVVSQNSAATNVQLAYVRDHNEDDELFKAKAKRKKGYRTVKKKVKYRHRGTVDDIRPKYGGKITYTPINDDGTPASTNDAGNVGSSAQNDKKERLFEVIEEISRVPVYEEVDIPFEDQVRPPWVSPLYNNDRIDEFYMELLGCKSILDSELDSTEKQIKEVEKKESGSTSGVTTATSGSTGVKSVKESVDRIVEVYRRLRSKFPDKVVDFVDEFRRRPIATKTDVLGSENLAYDERGKILDPFNMVEGFHSRAFANYNLDDAISQKRPSDITGMRPLPIDPAADPRAEKREAVIEYLVALLNKGVTE